MVFGIVEAQHFLFVDTRTQIGRVIRMIENQHPGLANSLVGPWYVGLLRSNISLSTAEAEYVAAVSACTQLLWMRQTSKEYGVHL